MVLRSAVALRLLKYADFRAVPREMAILWNVLRHAPRVVPISIRTDPLLKGIIGLARREALVVRVLQFFMNNIATLLVAPLPLGHRSLSWSALPRATFAKSLTLTACGPRRIIDVRAGFFLSLSLYIDYI